MTDHTYRVNDVYACIQGEGALAGLPMVLLRLHGCGVGCPFCDTKETWETTAANRVPTLDDALGANPRWCEMTADALAAALRERFPRLGWVLVTGGEPADQPLGPLVEALHRKHFIAALETSGTALGHVGARFHWVCVSPKIGMPGGRPILPDALASANEIKMVIGRQSDLDKLDTLLADHRGHIPASAMISLQPMSANATATRLCLETALARGWRLSLQLHKYIGAR